MIKVLIGCCFLTMSAKMWFLVAMVDMMMQLGQLVGDVFSRLYKLSEIKNLVQKNVSEIRQYIGLSVALYSSGGARAYVIYILCTYYIHTMYYGSCMPSSTL